MGDKVAVFAAGGRLAQYDEPAALLGRPADDFVAEFVGASRGLRRLSVTPIERGGPRPARGRAGARQSVPLSSTLEDALATMLRQDDARGSGSAQRPPLGVLTPDAVHRALRNSIAAEG